MEGSAATWLSLRVESGATLPEDVSRAIGAAARDGGVAALDVDAGIPGSG